MRCVSGVRLGAALAWGWACGVMWAARGQGSWCASAERGGDTTGREREGHALTYEWSSLKCLRLRGAAAGCAAIPRLDGIL